MTSSLMTSIFFKIDRKGSVYFYELYQPEQGSVELHSSAAKIKIFNLQSTILTRSVCLNSVAGCMKFALVQFHANDGIHDNDKGH